MHELGRQAVDVGGTQPDGAVVCCPLVVGVWWTELDFDEDKAEVLMEEDESDDDIVVVCCSVLEGVEYLEQSQAKLGAVEEIINVLKIVHEGVENIGVSMCKKEPLTDGSAMLNTGELEITFTLRER